MQAVTASPATARRPRFQRRTRNAVLVLHVASIGAWIGVDVVLGVLVFTALGSDDVDVKALCYRALGLFLPWPLLVAGLATLATGITLGLGTVYGVLRYWWVVTKLGLNLVLSGLVPVLLGPALSDAVLYGRQLGEGQPATESVLRSVDNLVFPPLVSGAALLVAVILAVYKPWGRIRRRPA
jgi:hypothetical protein